VFYQHYLLPVKTLLTILHFGSGIVSTEKGGYSRMGSNSKKRTLFMFTEHSPFFSRREEPSQDLSYERAFFFLFLQSLEKGTLSYSFFLSVNVFPFQGIEFLLPSSLFFLSWINCDAQCL
jgi:hypothetical protein